MRRLLPLTVLASIAIALGIAAVGAAHDDAPAQTRSDGLVTETADGPPCADPVVVDGLGLSCPTGDGAWQVHVGDGLWMRTHGPDPEAPASSGSRAGSHSLLLDRASPADVTCVGASSPEFHVQVVYAYAKGETDRSDAFADDMRATIREANGLVRYAAAEEDGAYRNLKVGCDDQGAIRVEVVQLSTTESGTSFSSVVKDMAKKGYAEPHEKYWIFVDPHSESVNWGGTSSLPHDSSDSYANRNNFGATYSVNWGTFYAGTWLHELFHAMGAVQRDAPNFYDNYGGWHCDDEWDIMCYGPRTYTRCGNEHLDCGHDDYFDPRPEDGTYLEDHWNVAGDENRFMVSRSDPCQGDVQLRASSASDTCQAAVSTRDDAGASYAAASGTGAADAIVPLSLVGDCGSDGPCNSIAPQDAEAETLAVSPGESQGAVAVAGTGEADGGVVGVSALGPSHGTVAVSGDEASGVYAVSARDEAQGCRSGSRCVAVSGGGPAEAGLAAASVTGQANSTVAAASGTGAAGSHGTFCAVVVCSSGGGAAVSGTSTADGAVAVSGTDAAKGDVAVSGTGPARGGVALSGANDCGNQVCHDVDPTGDAEASTLAVSGTGTSDAAVAVSGRGPAEGSVAASGTGPARSCYTPGDSPIAVGCVAVSATGESEADNVAVSGTGDASSPMVAVTGTGDARSCSWGHVATVSGTGTADACPNFLGMTNAVSGCEAVRVVTGSGIACRDVNPEQLLP